MELTELITRESIIPNLHASSKKQALQKLAERAAELAGRPERDILEAFTRREELGAIGIGQGIGIPLGSLPEISRPYLFFAHLREPIDFGAIDGEPVDLLCAFLTPDTNRFEYLPVLAWISRLLQDQSMCEKLRGADNTDSILALFSEAIESLTLEPRSFC